MKHKITMLFLFLGTMALFLGCQKEDEITQETEITQSPYKVSFVNGDIVQTNSKVFNKIKSLNRVNETDAGSLLAREVYNEEYGFVIETVFVKYVEDVVTGHHSYNFPIIKWDSPPSDKVFNLLFSSRTDGDYDVYIVQYGFTKEEYEIVDISQLQGLSTKYKSIVFDELDDLVPYNGARFAWDCDESWVWSSGTEHNGDLHGVSNNGGCVVAGCSYQSGGLVLESKVCAFTGGGEGGSTTWWDDFWTNTDTNGGTGTTGNSNPIVSSPTVPTTGQLLAVDLGNLLGITDQEILFWIEIQTNWFKAGKLKDFIEDNNCGLESGNQNSATCQDVYDFAEDILMIMMGDPVIRYNDAFMMAEVNDCLGMEVYLPVETIEDVHGYLIDGNDCSEEAQEHVIEFSEIVSIKVCLNSFEFTDVGSNWQNAGLSNVNVQFLTLGWPSNLRNVNFPELHFGLPKILSSGEYITNNNARYEAQDIMTQAELLTNLYQSINPNSTSIQLKTYFLEKMQEISAQRGGTVGTSAPLGWTGQLKPHQTYFISITFECD